MGSPACRGGWPAAGVLYRVDPRLFRDGDGDGIGDLPGLIAELDYLRWLGVDAVWPVFDAIAPDDAWDGLLPVACPEGIHLADGHRWRTLTAAAHRRGMRVVIGDWANACRVCRDGGRALPNDSAARSGGAASGAARSDLSLRTAFGNGIDAVWAGDGWAVPPVGADPTAAGRGAAQVVEPSVAAAVPATLRALLTAFPLPGEAALPALVAAGLLAAAAAPNADRPTIWTVLPGSAPRLAGAFGARSARALAPALALLLLCLPGVAAIASGDELGLTDGPPTGPADPSTGRPPRWPERAPMVWDEEVGGGFASWPWRPLAASAAAPASRQRADPDSLLALYRRAIALRRCASALAGGDLIPVAAADGLLAALREDRTARFLVALNLGGEAVAAAVGSPRQGHVALATRRQREGNRAHGEVRLDPGEAVVVRLDR